MEGKSLVVVEQPQNVQTASVLIIEQFLNDHYRLRRNVLSGKVEFKVKSELTADYRPLTQEALNSLRTLVYGYARLWPTGCNSTRCTAMKWYLC